MPPLTVPNREPELLHPAIRGPVAEILQALAAEGKPFRLFEGYRSPERQAYLYTQGRTRGGSVITNARAWQSYHQYGLAVDLVPYVDGNWTWGADPSWWKQLHELGKAHGLEPLHFEQPHLQVAGLRIADLQAGKLPAGGDDGWRVNLLASAGAMPAIRGALAA